MALMALKYNKCSQLRTGKSLLRAPQFQQYKMPCGTFAHMVHGTDV